MPGYMLTYVMELLRPELGSVLTDCVENHVLYNKIYSSDFFPREKNHLIKKDMSETAGT